MLAKLLIYSTYIVPYRLCKYSCISYLSCLYLFNTVKHYTSFRDIKTVLINVVYRGVAKVVRGGAAHHLNFLAHHLRWCAPGVIIYYTLENHASVPYKYFDSNGSAKLLLLQL